jgi:hypothetical protein
MNLGSCRRENVGPASLVGSRPVAKHLGRGERRAQKNRRSSRRFPRKVSKVELAASYNRRPEQKSRANKINQKSWLEKT